jgi:hypothetical protein
VKASIDRLGGGRLCPSSSFACGPWRGGFGTVWKTKTVKN